ncbi:transposase [Streptomyces sp. NPDC048252]|uniref:transposase n=1 Tax=Streptomyces sp. NPDC048252 TaxID=3154612 RepID=UPI0034449CAD
MRGGVGIGVARPQQRVHPPPGPPGRGARAQEDSREWREQYAHRADVEGAISQVFEPRSAAMRGRGLAKARLQHQLTATAMNFHRLNAWWTGTPRACTRTSLRRSDSRTVYVFGYLKVSI